MHFLQTVRAHQADTAISKADRKRPVLSAEGRVEMVWGFFDDGCIESDRGGLMRETQIPKARGPIVAGGEQSNATPRRCATGLNRRASETLQKISSSEVSKIPRGHTPAGRSSQTPIKPNSRSAGSAVACGHSSLAQRRRQCRSTLAHSTLGRKTKSRPASRTRRRTAR